MEIEDLAEIRRDASRYAWLRSVMAKSVGGGIEVNDAKLYYEEPTPGKEVRVFWYPDTPVGFFESHGKTLDEAIDGIMNEVLEG